LRFSVRVIEKDFHMKDWRTEGSLAVDAKTPQKRGSERHYLPTASIKNQNRGEI
jgi:hypothetical protein